MALDIVTAITDPAAAAAAPPRAAPESKPQSNVTAPPHPVHRRLSPLTRRILFVNVLALGLLGFGFLYLGEYQDSLIAANLDSLRTQARIFAAALGEGAVVQHDRNEDLVPQSARDMMRRLVEPTETRARLFDNQGNLLGDTAVLSGPGGAVEVAELPPPGNGFLERLADRLYDGAMALFPWQRSYPSYREPPVNATAADFPEVQRALSGDLASQVQSDRPSRSLILTVAVPVQHYRQVLGAVQLSIGSSEIDKAVRSVRFAVLKVFAFALGVTVLLSIYLAGTIARPIRRLAEAAENVRHRQGREVVIPDLTRRGDEIGDLSGALRHMTSALWQRVDAIERFAADVAHEIKNPLTSLRSAIETVTRLDDPAKQRRLLGVVIEDVDRLNRLITDISDASRLDAELARIEPMPVALGPLLSALAAVHEAGVATDSPQLKLMLPGDPGTPEGALMVAGIEDRLMQVFRNLIVNAVSFSPPGGSVRVDGRRDGAFVVVTVDDDGPGIPEGKLQAIFERFYTERPAGEKFGTHSGLGLAISKQIVDSHRGRIVAENRRDAAGHYTGARFSVWLPAGP